jgi:hypothetical protein
MPSVRRGGSNDVGDAIAVHIANVAGDPAELIAGSLTAPFSNDSTGSTNGCSKSAAVGSNALKRESVRNPARCTSREASVIS